MREVRDQRSVGLRNCGSVFVVFHTMLHRVTEAVVSSIGPHHGCDGTFIEPRLVAVGAKKPFHAGSCTGEIVKQNTGESVSDLFADGCNFI